jgi:hypothetical protein
MILKTLKPISELKDVYFPKCTSMCKEFESLGPMKCYDICPHKFKRKYKMKPLKKIIAIGSFLVVLFSASAGFT